MANNVTIARDYFIKQANVLNSAYAAAQVAGHKGDTGSNREVILKDWLSRHIPKRVTVEIGGKIIDSQGSVSKQVDIVVYDSSFPAFGANEKQYFFAEGVITAIQVKSSLTPSTLKGSVENLNTVKKCARKFGGQIIMGEVSNEISTGIFAYETNYASSKNIIETLNKLVQNGLSPVDFVCINKKTFIAFNYGKWKGDKGQELPAGYLALDNRDGCIWRMVISIAQETRKIVSASVNFQEYFFGSDETRS